MDGTTWQGTVLLADVRRDAALLYAAVGAARALAAVRECVEVLAHAARTRGGNVVRAMGDEVVAVFSAAGTAADAAIAMQAAMDALPPVASVKLGVRIAFHSGPVTVRDGDVLGKTVTLASQLLEQANREQILTSPDTASGLDTVYRQRLRLRPRSPERDEITSCEFVWQVGGETGILELARGARAPGKVHLRLKYGVNELSSAQVELVSIRIGRDMGCDLFVLEPLASRHHCTLERRGEAFVLRDHSTNGSFITEEGGEEIRVQQDEAVLGRHGWLAFGQPRQHSEHVVEYFSE